MPHTPPRDDAPTPQSRLYLDSGFPTHDEYAYAHRCPTCRAEPGQPGTATGTSRPRPGRRSGYRASGTTPSTRRPRARGRLAGAGPAGAHRSPRPVSTDGLGLRRSSGQVSSVMHIQEGRFRPV